MSISENIAAFRKTGNPFFLIKALLLTLKQNRIKELLFGIYCNIFSSPAILHAGTIELIKNILSSSGPLLSSKFAYSRNELIGCFGDYYEIGQLPHDFSLARKESIVIDPDFLIIGECVDSNKRIAYITSDSCTINNTYATDKQIGHIHAIHKIKSSSVILVTTGDAAKYLDQWELKDGRLTFIKRLKKSLSGYTAIVCVNGDTFWGTDFSSRPNYIERSDGKRFFFPQKAYRMYVVAFHECFNRYILSINKDIHQLGNKWALSIFDTITEKFIYCEYYNDPQQFIDN